MKKEATDSIRDRSRPAASGLLEPVEVGLHHRVVAVEGEDQCHVDADALGEAPGDRGQSLAGGGDLDEQVGPVDHPPQQPGLGDGAVGVVGQVRVDLDGHAAVAPVAVLVDRCEQVADRADVVGGQQPHGLGDRNVEGGQVVQLLGVDLAARDGLVEDGGVGGDADDVLVADQGAQRARHEPAPAHVVEPDRDTFVGKLAQRWGHDQLLVRRCLSAGRQGWRSGRGVLRVGSDRRRRRRSGRPWRRSPCWRRPGAGS